MEDSSDLADLTSCLRDIDGRKFVKLIDALMDDFRVSVNGNSCSSVSLVRIYLSTICFASKYIKSSFMLF